MDSSRGAHPCCGCTGSCSTRREQTVAKSLPRGNSFPLPPLGVLRQQLPQWRGTHSPVCRSGCRTAPPCARRPHSPLLTTPTPCRCRCAPAGGRWASLQAQQQQQHGRTAGHRAGTTVQVPPTSAACLVAQQQRRRQLPTGAPSPGQSVLTAAAVAEDPPHTPEHTTHTYVVGPDLQGLLLPHQ